MLGVMDIATNLCQGILVMGGGSEDTAHVASLLHL